MPTTRRVLAQNGVILGLLRSQPSVNRRCASRRKVTISTGHGILKRSLDPTREVSPSDNLTVLVELSRESKVKVPDGGRELQNRPRDLRAWCLGRACRALE